MTKATPFPTIVVDSREQQPFTFDGLLLRGGAAPRVEFGVALPAGDYSLRLDDGELLPVIVERKSPVDLYGTLGEGRKRFMREVERAASLGVEYFALVVESSMKGLSTRPRHVRKMEPRAVLRTLISLSVKHGVHVWTPGGRATAEKWTLRILEFYWEKWRKRNGIR